MDQIGGAISLFFASNVSPQIVLKLYRARRLPEHILLKGHAIIRELSARADLPSVPELYFVPSRMLNAFTVGGRDDAVICVTGGLLRELSLREFAGVMALADVVSRLTGSMSLIDLMILLFNLPIFMMNGAGVSWLGILLLLAVPTIGGLMQLALSRTREYDADLDAVSLSGDPAGLASALAKLEKVRDVFGK
ncbi:zinc metalloprotease HtpX [Breoghania sp.]|uniref:zinc metalloprotease HtpX n=1 Tax=Breoghania sp. TaxID=2065378 RepID=UPI0026335441|nr:zinc metalloprotease HtpX [Breoghania sp.]MDJ0932855.1 zinc metalloprotease HtpX [Breoghania sp.]